MHEKKSSQQTQNTGNRREAKPRNVMSFETVKNKTNCKAFNIYL